MAGLGRRFILATNAMPFWVRRLIGSVGRHIFKWEPTAEERRYFEQLAQTQYATAGEHYEVQRRKLQKLIRHAVAHVPYYRDLFREHHLTADDIQKPEDLAKLPLLSKQIIRENPEAFIATGVDTSACEKVTTGGSTGTPGLFYFDEHMVGVRRAHWWRWNTFAGVDLYRDLMAYCGGGYKDYYPPDKYRGIVPPNARSIYFNASVMSEKVLDRYVHDLMAFKPHYFRGYASAAYIIARHMVSRGKTFKLKAVLTSSDTLFPSYRTVIEQAFDCQVFDHYGQNEDILTANECAVHSGLHINVESCIPETVDASGEVVRGCMGRLVSTHLENYSMPLIRYLTGDVGVLPEKATRCECGRSQLKLLEFCGRDDEIIVTPDGRQVGCGAMNQPMKDMPQSIKQCQFIQEATDQLRIRVVPTDRWDDVTDREHLIKNTHKQVGDAITVQVELVDDIPPRPNGKYQFIVSHLNR